MIVKNNDQKCFLWCHVKHINAIKTHPERIRQSNKELANDLNYDGVEFPVQEKDFSKIEEKNSICINLFCYENKLTFPIYILAQKFENSIDLLLVTGETSHIMCTSKILTDLCFTKGRIKTKNTFEKVVCSVSVAKMC